jgi:hypothetical protein
MTKKPSSSGVRALPKTRLPKLLLALLSVAGFADTNLPAQTLTNATQTAVSIKPAGVEKQSQLKINKQLQENKAVVKQRQSKAKKIESARESAILQAASKARQSAVLTNSAPTNAVIK